MAAAMVSSSSTEFCSSSGSTFLVAATKSRLHNRQLQVKRLGFRIQASNQPLTSSTGSNSSKTPPDEQQERQHQPVRKIPYGLVTALSGIGAIETAYLSWIKLSGGSPVCPVTAAPGCNDVLNSVYATAFGVPLSLVGLLAYSSISLLGFTMLQSSLDEDEMRWIFLGGTTAMAAASGYFMYLLTFKLQGASCAYCVASAVLSLGLFLSTLRGFRWKDVPQMAGLQLAVAAAVLVAFSTNTALADSEGIDLPPIEPEVIASSDVTKVSLAKHLKSIGAKMYGAFWCSHCHEQKEELGKEAMEIVDYVECFPDGYKKGVKIAEACAAAKIEGFPTWVIKDKTYSGELTLKELAEAAGFKIE